MTFPVPFAKHVGARRPLDVGGAPTHDAGAIEEDRMVARRFRSGAVPLSLVLALAACQSGTSQSPTSAAATSAPATAASSPAASSASTTHQFSWGSFTLAPSVAAKVAGGQPVNIVIDNQGTAIPIFGAQQKAGMDAACTKDASILPVSCRNAGPATTNNTAQLTELQTLLTSQQVDCLGIEVPEPGPFVDIINKYVAAGIPVFTENADAPDSHRFAFFAINELQGGILNGKTTAQLVQAGAYQVSEIAMGSGSPTGPWAQSRGQGFAQGFQSVLPNVKLFNDYKAEIPTGADFTDAEVISSVTPFLTANPKVNLFFHTDQGVEGVGTVIKNLGLTGKVWTSGYNVSAAIFNDIDAGRTLVTIDQGFDVQAGAAVDACANYLKSGALPADPLAYTSPIVITKNGGPGLESTADARKRLGFSQ
jgi:ABC-type sugar transport system substrate-binding protein